MTNYKKNNLILVQRLVSLLLIYQISRVLFCVFNPSTLTSFNFQTLKGSLIFDLASIAYLNLVFIIAHMVPGNFKYSSKYQKRLKISFYTLNLLFIATNFVDIIYYRFTGRRSTFSMITAKGMEHEIMGLIPSFLKEFWYLGVLFIIVSYVFWKLLPNLKQISANAILTKKDLIKQSSYLVLALATGLLIARGGFRKKPVKIVDAVAYGELGNSALVLNTPFCILKTITKKENIEKVSYFDDKELTSIYNPLITLNPDQPANKKNVVIIILESFGDENIGRGCTPFFRFANYQILLFQKWFC